MIIFINNVCERVLSLKFYRPLLCYFTQAIVVNFEQKLNFVAITFSNLRKLNN